MYIRDLEEPDIELSVKVVIVGNGGVGKSSMIQRYCRGTFTKSYKKTIGVDFLEKELRVQGENVRLMIWDTAGQEEFDAITRSYYRGAQACVITFSTTDSDSLFAVRKWKKKVEEECGYIPMVLVQNKIDLIQEAQVHMSEVEQQAASLGMRIYRVSVKEDLNVGSVFQHLAEDFVTQVRDFERMPRQLAIGKMSSSDRREMGGAVLILNGGTEQTRKKRVKFRQSDPCMEYLSNPIFDSLHRSKGFHMQQCRSGLVRPSCKNL